MNEWFLESTEDADVSICIVLNEVREYTIGRKKGFDIVSPNPLVSRNHGVIKVTEDGQIYIRDLKSANGTYINDKAILPFKDVLLEKGNLLGIGAPSTAIEPKKELFWVRCKPRPRTSVKIVVLKEADSTSVEELHEIDEAQYLKEENGVPSSKILHVPKLRKDIVIVDDEIFSKNVPNTNSDSFKNNIKVLEHVKTTKDNNSERIAEENEFCKKSCSANKDITPVDIHTSSSSINATSSDSKDRNISEIKKSFIDITNSDFKNKNSLSSKVVEKPPNTDLIKNIEPLGNSDKNCETSKNKSENANKLLEKINDDLTNNTSIPPTENVKLSVDYLNCLMEKRNKRKQNISKIIICSSSDEEETSKTKNNSSDSVKKTNNDDSETDDNIVVKSTNIKTEPKNHSFTQHDDDDIVIVSDDDDEIFPKSQIFGDIQTKVKREALGNENVTSTGNCTSPASDNNDNNQENIYREMVKNEIPEYDYNDNDEDAFDNDDDCIVWYSKLSQSQDLLLSSQKKQLEISHDPPDVVEQDDFPKFDDIDEIFGKDFEKHQDEHSRESRTSPVASDINKDDEQSKSKDVEPELDDTTDSRPNEKISSSSSTKLLIDEKEEEKCAKKKLETKKSYVKPPVIDAPFLKKGKRKPHEDDKNKDTTSSKTKRRKSIHEDAAPVPAVVKTAVPSSVLHIDKSVKEELDKRHKSKKRRQSTETLTRNEKQKIQEDRKKKLKELASKISETKEKKDEVQKSHHTKPKVKVSTGRGLFLTGVDPKHASKKKKSDVPLEEELASKKKYKIPRRPDSVSSEPSTSKANTSTEPNISKINKLTFNNIETVVQSKSETKEPVVKKKNNKLSFNHLEKQPVEKSSKLSISSNNNVTNDESKSGGILLVPDKNRNSGKRVKFKDEPEIRYIERTPGNSCRKVNSKDAPVPVMVPNIREEDKILSTILEWRPAWLEEQKGFNESPQVSRRNPLRMLTNFNSFRDYADIITPLMLLELWRSVFRDWCYNNAPVKLACIENIQQKNNGLFVYCYCLAQKDNMDNYFRGGELLVTEFYLDDSNSKTATIKKFGYVVNVFKQRMIPSDVVHKKLIERGPMPQFKIRITINIKNLQVKILQDKLMRVRLVSRIGPQLRIFKSVLNLHSSPLCHFILRPNVQQYKITKPTQMTSAIEDKLNNDQMICVYEAYQICIRNEPGIYLIQGPPGTGKSYVIKNLIRQLLSDETKSKNLPNCRILLCAPSNGAVDEIANTLLEMRSKMAKTDRFKMLRLGPPSSIANAKVKSISLQTLMDKHLVMQQNNNIKTNSFMNEEYNFLIEKEKTIKNTLINIRNNNLDVTSGTYSSEVSKLKSVQVDLERLKSNANSLQEKRKQERDTEILILQGAQIICSTLSSCIGSKLEELVAEKKIEFTCCIVDEATQSSEPESLIPLLLRINKLVLVGDPEQLPPTTISHEAKDLGHGNSLFSRIQKCLEHLPENPIRMLTNQYRMNLEICKFPSKNFYGGRLKTAEVILSKTEAVLDPYRLFCLNSSIDYKENEYLNKTEANLVLLLTDIVVKRTKYNVGIITPYTKQKEFLLSRYSSMRAKENKDNNEKEEERYQPRVVINTVDGFQGQERDVIIISSVRYKSNIFLNDLQRLNVALTRAKHAVFICAHANLFKAESIWQKLEVDAKSRNFFYPLTEKDATDERYMSELILRR